MTMKRCNASDVALMVSFYLILSLLGAAYLVIHKTEKKKYIAKQIML